MELQMLVYKNKSASLKKGLDLKRPYPLNQVHRPALVKKICSHDFQSELQEIKFLQYAIISIS